jgi:hypothetical protein
MSKVITFSTVFPSYHPKKGDYTYFVEKIYNSLGDLIPRRKSGFYFEQLSELNPNLTPTIQLAFYDSVNREIIEQKHHTIRAGKRFKVGDMASMRIWGDDINPKSGRKGAYHSKQITIAPETEIFYAPKIEIYKTSEIIIDGKFYATFGTDKSRDLAKNDGLSEEDLKNWFKYPKNDLLDCQIICWNKDLKY